MHPSSNNAVLTVEGLNVRTDKGMPLLRGVSFDVAAGACLGLIGASGSGKSMTALAILGLLPRGLSASGTVTVDGRSYQLADTQKLAQLRGRSIGMVPQNPKAALNPVRRLGAQIDEVLRLDGLDRATRRERAEILLQQVGIPDAALRLRQYAHELSGGLCQRAMVALALARSPRILIADEPTTALDLSIAAQIIDLLDDMRPKLGLAVLLISHDMHVITGSASRIASLHDGQIIETTDQTRFVSAEKLMA